MDYHVLENCSAFLSRSPTLMTATTLRWWSTWGCSCSLLPWSQHPLQTASPSWDWWRKSCVDTYFKWVWFMLAWHVALGESDTNLHARAYCNSAVWGWAGLSLQISSLLHCSESSELHQWNSAVAKPERLLCAIFFRSELRRMQVIWMNSSCRITLFWYNWFWGNHGCKLPA